MREVLWLVLETVGSLLASACVLRLWLVWAGMAMRDPIGHFIFSITEWLVGPLRSFLPRRKRLDWSCLFASALVAIILAAAFVLLYSVRPPSFGAVVLLALSWLARWALWLLIGMLLLQAVLSWVNPYAPIMPMLQTLTQPLLAPLQRRLPRVGGVDLSPLVLILIAQALLILVRSIQPMV